MGRRKGFMSAPGGIVLVIIFAVVALGTMTVMFGGAQEFLKGVCEKSPQLPFCGDMEERFDTNEGEIALHSTEALSCAVNAVVAGEEPGGACTKAFKPESETPGIAGYGSYGYTTQEISTFCDSNPSDSECTAACTQTLCAESGCTVEAAASKGKTGSLCTCECHLLMAPSSVQCTRQTSAVEETPVIRYDEDRGFLGIGDKDDVCYKYSNTEKWLWGFCKDESFVSVSASLGDSLDAVSLYTQDGLKKASMKDNPTESYLAGLDVFKALFDGEGTDMTFDGKDTDMGNDDIRILYADGSRSRWIHNDDSDFYVQNDKSVPEEHVIGGAKNYWNIAELMNYHDPLGKAPVDVCTVKGFYLPQDVTNAEKWIAGYGDPQFLVYWQAFPLGEDNAWTSQSTWMQNVGTAVIMYMPAAKILKGGKYLIKGAGQKAVSVTGTTISKAGKGILSRLFKREVTEEAAETASYVILESGLSKAVKREAYAKAVGQGLFKELIIGTEKHYGAGLVPLLKVAGVTTVGAWVGAYMDSLNDKYEYLPGSIVLDMPYRDRETFALPTLSVKKDSAYPLGLSRPVILKRNYDPYQVSFYLASPCHADLTVKKEKVYCAKYTYNSADGSAYCDPSDEHVASDYWGGVQKIPYCGDVPVDSRALADNRLFSDNNVDGKWDEVSVNYLLDGVNTLKMYDDDGDGRLDRYFMSLYSPNYDVASTGTDTGKIDFDRDGTFDATFESSDVPNGVWFEVKDIKGNTICSYLDQGSHGSGIQTIFAHRDDGSIALKFPADVRVSPYDLSYTYHTCRALSLHGTRDTMGRNPYLVDSDGDGNWDTFYIESEGDPTSTFFKGGVDVRDLKYADGLWDYFDEDHNGRPNLIYDKDFGTVMTYSCDIDAVTVEVENKDNYKDEKNFCYARPKTGTRTAILIGTFVADAVMEYFSAGFLTQVAVSLTAAGMHAASLQFEKWPG